MEATESCVFIEEGACETVITDDVVTEEVTHVETVEAPEEATQAVSVFLFLCILKK